MSGKLRRDWWANPWAKPRFLVLFTALYLTWSIVPILIAIRFSFNEGRSRSTAQGWSLRWYTEDPDLSVLHDPALQLRALAEPAAGRDRRARDRPARRRARDRADALARTRRGDLARRCRSRHS